MNVYIIIVLAFLGSCTATVPLTSKALGKLIVKYAKNEILDFEYKILEKIFRLYKYVWDSVDNVTKAVRCFVCRSGFIALMALMRSGVSEDKIIDVGTKLCSISISSRVCRGVLTLNLPILIYIIKNTPEATPKNFCGLWLQSERDSYTCAHDDPRFEWQIKLPPKVKIFQQDYSIYDDSEPLTVAVVSDFHVDPLYQPFSEAECEEPACCRRGQKRSYKNHDSIDERMLLRSVLENDEEIILNTDAATKIVDTVSFQAYLRKGRNKPAPAGFWGDYRKCDTPIWAFIDVIEQIASHKEVDIVYYIGDNIDHHIWETTYKLVNEVNSLVFDKMKKILRKGVIVVPAIGNHDSQPLNMFAPDSVKGEGLNTTWLYKSLANKWSYYLTKEATDSVKQRGGFSMLIRPGLRVISINNNVAYKLNSWLLYDPLYPKRYLEWLVQELYKAELSGEKVHILSHIPPGDQDLIYTWTREYYRIIDRFSSTITAEFNGHIHSDQFKIFYKDGKAFSVAWGAGSATTNVNFNLNYKIVTFDNNNFKPTSMVNYIYNLTEANLGLYQRPRWYKLYDMESSFQLQNLSATSMDRLVHEMVTNEKYLLDLYVKFSSKLSDAAPNCDTNCELEMLCNAVTTVLWDRTKCSELMELYVSNRIHINIILYK